MKTALPALSVLILIVLGEVHVAMSNSPANKPLYLNIIWHQHQPLYLDPATDQLKGPWVRTHGTKDYYDMVAILEHYPDIHATVNLTSSLLYQLEEYYVRRLAPFVDTRRNRIKTKEYFRTYGGKTDPWIDVALKPAETFTEKDLQILLYDAWNAFSINDVMIGRFPEYKALRDRFRQHGGRSLTIQQLREVKFWFYAAHFDPDFLEKKVRLIGGDIIDLSDLLVKDQQGHYLLRKQITEEDCQRIVVETFKILSNIIPAHKKLMYHPISHKGQVEVITTPFYHPILPLIYDSDIAKLCQPDDPMPARFYYPQDADVQIAKSVAYYRKLFGQHPMGMWPAEGSVAHDLVPVFARHGIRWIATDEKVLARSKPGLQPKFYPYGIYTNHGTKDSLAIVFRDTELSDRIGFTYQQYRGSDAADDFVNRVLQNAPEVNGPDRLLTVILDGENAWEWYRFDNDGKEFLHSLYRKLSELYRERRIVTVTMTEYIHGNPTRGIPAHPLSAMPGLEWLWPGSWINANFDTWIGEDEENRAWEYLLTARRDLEQSGLRAPDPMRTEPRRGTKAWYAYKAWEAIYAAEGSDWFWWYGADQTAGGGDDPFDNAFLTHLKNVYHFARLAGASLPRRSFEPILKTRSQRNNTHGTMARSRDDLVPVLFRCDARNLEVGDAIYIVGNHESLANWRPNVVAMRDDGREGDEKAGDGVWSLQLLLPKGFELQYKYTNSGPEGHWTGEEFPVKSRRLRIEQRNGQPLIIMDKFGVLE